MKKPKKTIAKVPDNEKIVGAGGNELINPNSRAKKKKKQKNTDIFQLFKNTR